MRNKENRKLNRDNRGFSFVLVIVAMAVVTLLIVTILYVALQNYQMKQTNLKSEDNFYSAEQVLDEIKAGLQTDINASISEAYNYVLERYTETEGQDTTRNWYFQTRFVDGLRAKLLGNANDGTYDLEHLKSYISNTATKGVVTLTTSVTSQNLETSYASGVTLKGLHVTYERDGYQSVIATDLNIAIPDIDFTQTANAPDLLSYGIIADKGIDMTYPNGQYAIEGNVYAGGDGIQLGQDADVVVTSMDRTVINGPIVMADQSTAQFNVGALWADDISVTSAKLGLNGNVFVRDDLTLDGKNSEVAMQGRYYGFSNPELVQTSNVYKDGYLNGTADVAKSSAIVINGRTSSLNLQNLERMLLAGNTYVDARMSETDTNAINVKMGESITVKSNQLAYLAPAAAIIIEGGGRVEPGNPIVGLAAGAKVSLDTSIPLLSLGRKTLGELGITANNCKLYYTQNNIAYVYMDFTTDQQAAKYFQAYYGANANSKEFKEYMDLYLNAIQINPDSMVQFKTNGNVLTKNSLVRNTIITQSDINEAQAEENSYQDMYFALSKKLITMYTALSTEEKEQTVFDNLVQNKSSDSPSLSRFASSEGGKVVFTTKTSGQKAVLVDGNYTVSSADAANTRLILADGNVLLEANVDFTGLIICSGRLIFGNGATVTADSQAVASVFQSIICESGGTATERTDGISPMSFFRDGSQYVIGGVLNGNVTEIGGNAIDVADLITYKNWKKL